MKPTVWHSHNNDCIHAHVQGETDNSYQVSLQWLVVEDAPSGQFIIHESCTTYSSIGKVDSETRMYQRNSPPTPEIVTNLLHEYVQRQAKKY